MEITGMERGVTRQDIYNIRFYEKSNFNGSLRGMNYRIEKVAGDAPQFKVTTWPGPMNFDHTDDALKVTAFFDFTDDALNDIAEYLNRFHEEHF